MIKAVVVVNEDLDLLLGLVMASSVLGGGAASSYVVGNVFACLVELQGNPNGNPQ